MVRLILHKTFIEAAILRPVLFNRTTMTSLLLLFAMLYAACGLVLSIVVNVVSFTSVQLGGNALFPVLMWGIFPAFLSVILIGISEREGKMRSGVGEEIDHWELVFAGCPSSMKYIFWVCFVYAWAIGIVLAILQTHEPNLIWRGASAFWMAFYALGLASVTGAYLRRGAPQTP
ncbi:hypothetical protein SAMN05192541_107320 [Bradyrhizobium arachidis]|uniref:Uncharacterized protein n=2 Tax=Bradyrhizobium arachidis TaxID=858423 RepID=A0AAE7NY34_9BRAD|nr:hypothetical protein WN72_42945 [Bradyrhizobium arachidis]SFU93635.1 hypothetical protein SAMN05192541_107320 [Bradyrhizobium arachidis]